MVATATESPSKFKLTPRWSTLRPHAGQLSNYASTAPRTINHSGRRSGKSEVLKRKYVKLAMKATWHRPRFGLTAPTHGQAKKIFWQDIKEMSPKRFVERVSESELSITYINGAELFVTGLDVPERIEGPPLDGLGLDEYGNMREDVWYEHALPALAERNGRADFIGVPEGRNHYWELVETVKDDPNWDIFHWHSDTVLTPAQIGMMAAGMDELTFDQECGGLFVSFSGRAYYAFETASHVIACRGSYDPKRDLALCFDFNVSPGVAAIVQERDGRTMVIGEVYIERGSNTPAICRKLAAAWGGHQGRVICYGDATGGAKGTAKVEGTDWDLIRDHLRPTFGDRLRFRVPKANPRVRVRVVATNTRIRNRAGADRLIVDPSCTHVIRDFEGVRCKEDGDIDKKRDPKLTHISDAIGYYVAKKHPIRPTRTRSTTV